MCLGSSNNQEHIFEIVTVGGAPVTVGGAPVTVGGAVTVGDAEQSMGEIVMRYTGNQLELAKDFYVKCKWITVFISPRVLYSFSF